MGARALGADVVVPLVSSLGSREKLFICRNCRSAPWKPRPGSSRPTAAAPETIDGRTVDYFGLSCVVDPRGDLVDRLPAHHHDDLLG